MREMVDIVLEIGKSVLLLVFQDSVMWWLCGAVVC